MPAGEMSVSLHKLTMSRQELPTETLLLVSTHAREARIGGNALKMTDAGMKCAHPTARSQRGGLPPLSELKLKYYHLMIRYYSYYNNYLEMTRCYKAVYEVPEVQADPSSRPGCVAVWAAAPVWADVRPILADVWHDQATAPGWPAVWAAVLVWADVRPLRPDVWRCLA
eukprot:1159658-Pelagomonas_calceolata.AAC.2